MPGATPTRDRILDQAVELFSRRGFRGVTITDIEQAAGLTPGAGGVFHHFPTKRAVLAAAIERRFQQVEALNLVRGAIPPLGDRRAELRLFARYLLDQLADERSLLALVLTEARHEKDLFRDAVRVLFIDRERAFARWIAGLPADVEPDDATLGVARLAIGALAYRPTVDVMLDTETVEPDDATIERWVTATLALTGG